MRTAWLAVTCWVALNPSVARADCADPFADPDDVLTFHVRLTEADWQSVRYEEPVGLGCEAQYPYFEVEFRCGETEPWITIGLRRKRGEQRGRDTTQKPPLKLDFNRYVQGQRWPEARGRLGFRRLSLNNGQADQPGGALTALLTEHYSWRLMRAEVPMASGVAYARLYVHLSDTGEERYHGLYILIEDIDRTAIRARYGTDEGRVLKTTDPECPDQVVFDDGANPTTEAAEEWLASDPGDFDAAVWWDRTDEVMYLEDLLRQEALRDVLNNVDDSVSGSLFNNYYVYDPPTDKRRYLPWDLDDLFRPFPQSLQYPVDTPLSETCSPVGERTRCLPDIRERYLEVACQLINGTLAEEKLLSEFAHLDALLRPIIAEEVEPVFDGSIVDKDPLDETTIGTYASEYDRYLTWIPERISFVREQITSAGVDCPDGCNDGESEACLYISCPSVRSCIDGRWTPCLMPEEILSNGTDDDCDGLIDEDPSASAGGEGGSSTTHGVSRAGATAVDGGAPSATEDDAGEDSGCTCRVGSSPQPESTASRLAWLLALAWLRRFRLRA